MIDFECAFDIARSVREHVEDHHPRESWERLCLVAAATAWRLLHDEGLTEHRIAIGGAHLQLGASGGPVDYGLAFDCDGIARIAPMHERHFHACIMLGVQVFDPSVGLIVDAMKRDGETFEREPPCLFLYERPAVARFIDAAPAHVFVPHLTIGGARR